MIAEDKFTNTIELRFYNQVCHSNGTRGDRVYANCGAYEIWTLVSENRRVNLQLIFLTSLCIVKVCLKEKMCDYSNRAFTMSM
jgi:hypothetical protein